MWQQHSQVLSRMSLLTGARLANTVCTVTQKSTCASLCQGVVPKMLTLFLTFILLSLRMSGAQEAAKGSPEAGAEVDLNGENPEVAPLDGLQGGFQPPSIEQLLSMVDTMEGLSDADREDLKQQLLQQQNMGVPAPEPSGLTSEALILLAALSLIIFIFVFFGYKLYKSLKDKERKRDEKRRLKQQKKKK